MRILSIDTTNRVIDIALSYNGEIFNIERNTQVNDYECIVSLIKLILNKSKLKIDQIDYFGVCIGPGSFTGIRIGLSVMKALAYSTKKPLIGFRSLDLLAYRVKDSFLGLLCIIQDARCNNIYSAVFNKYKVLHRISPYLLVRISELLKELKKINKEKVDLYFYGDMVLHYKNDIRIFFPSSKLLLIHHDVALRSRALISITKDNLRQESNSFKISPFYIYPKDCQVRKPAK